MPVHFNEPYNIIGFDKKFINCCYRCNEVILESDKPYSRPNKSSTDKVVFRNPEILCQNCRDVQKHVDIKKTRNIKRKLTLDNSKENAQINICWYIIFIILILIIFMITYSWLQQTIPETSQNIFKRLHLQFPSQKNETWYNLLSVLENKKPSVRSIVLLHGEDKNTLNCLKKELILLYTGDKNIDTKEITFKIDFTVLDYGEILVTYIQKVRKHGILVVNNINQVPASIARIFHSLCDEISSDIKPSLYIFTLQFQEKSENLNPITTAANILRKSWKELPNSDLDPLLARVIKNVIIIVPENKKTC